MFQKITTGLILVALVLPSPVLALSRVKDTYPRLANYYLSWTISAEEAKKLAQWDLLILDMEVAKRSPDALGLIRKENPSVVILAYITASEIRRDALQLKDIAPFRYKLASSIAENWYLFDAAGSRRSFWPGTYILNVTDKAPVVNGKRWNDFLVDFVTQEVLGTNLWDGVFYDNGWENITYFSGDIPDMDIDGKADSAGVADHLWREGLRKIYRATRERAGNMFVFENDGPIYAPEVHGVMVENFSKNNWWATSAALKKIFRESRQKIPILNANTKNTGQDNDFRAMRYGLATALIHDSFYSFDYGDKNHGQTWWYDEYEVYLGKPEGGMHTAGKGLVRRDFKQGIALANPTNVVQRVVFQSEFEKIIGEQDSRVNDGSIISTIRLASQDGIVLRRPIAGVFDAPYVNGSFVRVFDVTGKVARAGFFAYNRKYKEGDMLAEVDFGDHGKRDLIKASGRTLNIGKIRLEPFGKNFSGNIVFAVGDVNGDGTREIIATGEKAGGGEIRVYRSDGKLLALPFRAFGQEYKGGLNLAVGDLDGDGRAEIVVGAGAGSAPEVRVFSYEGKLRAPGFFAFDPWFEGGVKVSVGDINGDRVKEIVVGAGPGGGPQIRVFNLEGKVLSGGFFAFGSERRGGVMPSVVDVDGDGKTEILAATREVFKQQ